MRAGRIRGRVKIVSRVRLVKVLTAAFFVMPRSRVRSKNWCLTLNLGDDAPVYRARWTVILRRGNDRYGLSFIRFQEEIATTGQAHFQGYAEFSRRVRMAQVKRVFGDAVHVESREGTQAAAVHYVQKPVVGCTCVHCVKARLEPNGGRAPGGLSGSFGVLGEENARLGPGRPRGSQTRDAGVRVAEGATIEELLEEFPGVMLTHRGDVVDAIMARRGARNWAMEIEIFVGPTGCGKSTTAIMENPGALAVPWPNGGRWWMPGYEGQDCIILDEFRGQLRIDQMMKLFDRHAWPDCEAKGRSFQFLSKKVVITTNRDPCTWFPLISGVLAHANWSSDGLGGGQTGGQAWRHEELDALRRRIVEFAKIYDFARGQRYVEGRPFVKVLRTVPFDFLDTVMPPVHDFVRS